MTRCIWLLALVLVAPSCLAPTATSSTGAQAPADNTAVARAFADHRSQIEVTAQGQVERLLGDETSATGIHQRFILRLTGSSQTLLITNNVSIGKRVPVAVGDSLLVHGEYIWNEQGGLVHFTHHDPERAREGGWIERLGVRYD